MVGIDLIISIGSDHNMLCWWDTQWQDKYFPNFSLVSMIMIVAEILSSFHPDVSLADCPVLATKPPTIVRSGDSNGANPAYVTSDNAAPASVYPHIMATLLLTANILHQLLWRSSLDHKIKAETEAFIPESWPTPVNEYQHQKRAERRKKHCNKWFLSPTPC